MIYIIIMSALNRYFEHIFCINLDRRHDKWLLSVEEFEKHDLQVERFAAIDGKSLSTTSKITSSELGCSMSHAALLKMMISNNWNRILVLEDDVEFIPNIQDFFKENEHLIPKTWDMLYFGGNHMLQPVMINDVLGKIARTFTTSYYAISLNTAKAIIERIERFDIQIDVAYSHFHGSTNCYTFKPAIAWQKPGYSDIQEGFRDYTPFLKK